MPTISASILSADFSRLGEQIREAEVGGIDWIHVDVMDGHFVPNITMGPFIVDTVRQITRLPIETHLMISNPDAFLESFAEAGATHLTVHLESNPNIYRTLQKIRSLGCDAGIVLNPGTPANLLTEVLPIVDLVLVMTVNPGYSGQEFIPATVAKVREVRRMLDEIHSPAWLQVDGGINSETLPEILHAGATSLVAATAIFRHPQGILAGIRSLQQQFSTV
ncbi:MAG TPA: ribulose-phosphate 3-epimerase [Anaerolineaceae bacterium]|nr:ribulose-phosphate 3-epimerase [Anaerolineaceae bacterium]